MTRLPTPYRLLPLVGVVLAGLARLALAQTSPATSLDGQVRAAAENEQSIGMLEYRLLAYPCDDRGRRLARREAEETHVALGPAGQRYYRGFTTDAEGALTSIKWFVEDGRRRHEITPLPGFPDVLNIVEITEQANTIEPFRTGPMDGFLWLTQPDGRRLSQVLRNASSVQPSENGELRVVSPRKPTDIHLVLDPVHDWQPRQVSIADGTLVFHVDVFQRVEGLWFPRRGTSTMSETETQRPRMAFEVRDLKINDPATRRLLEPPPPTEGVIVADRTADGRSNLLGGQEARQRLLVSHGLDPERIISDSGDSNPQTTASREARSIPWSPLFLGLATGLFAVAWKLSRSTAAIRS